MDITLIIPYDEGFADVGCDISGGIRVYPGKLTLEQILRLTEEPAYHGRAVATKRSKNRAKDLEYVRVTFTNEEDDEPPVKVTDPGWAGEEYNSDWHAVGHLSYEVRYSTMEQPVTLVHEKVTVTDDGGQLVDEQFVQHEDTPEGRRERDSCLRYLADCGFEVETEPHPGTGPGDRMSWGELSDRVAPRDE